MKDLQKKFDDYKKKVHTKEGIGEFYERQIRYLYETKGWRVEPYGILKGKSDLGRDLICTKKKQVLIIQAKNWSNFHNFVTELSQKNFLHSTEQPSSSPAPSRNGDSLSIQVIAIVNGLACRADGCL